MEDCVDLKGQKGEFWVAVIVEYRKLCSVREKCFSLALLHH